MSKKPKAKENLAKDVETKKVNAAKRKELAAQLGELTLHRAKLADQLNKVDTRMQQLAMQMEKL